MRFPLDEKKVIGYNYGVPTSYSPKHLGVDWKAHYVPLYAPKNGTIINRLIAPAGGMTLWFQPDNEQVIIRWLHLSKFLVNKGQRVTEGQQIAITGNTGHSDLSHLHEDIWKLKVTLLFKDTLNPHEYYKKGNHVQLVNDKGTVYLVTGDKDKRKIGIADLNSLGLFGDEPQTPMDTKDIPQYNTIVDAKKIIHT